jgi:CheY-specific phosphatase CheX
MTAAFQIEEHLSEQARIATEVLRLIAGIVAEPVEARWPPKEELVTAAVSFTESWKGAMVLECVLPLAFEFTARLISVPLPTLVDADVCDSMGELVNMIAGNFKALMPAETEISIPSVVKGRDYLLRLRGGGNTLSQIIFRTEFGEFCLTLVGEGLE